MPSSDSWRAKCPSWCAHFGDPCILGRWAWIGKRCKIGRVGPLRMVRARHPAVAERMIDGLQANAPLRCLQSVRQCRQVVLDAGLLTAHHPVQRSQSPHNPSGWQQRASKKLVEKFLREEVWPGLSYSSLTALPTSKATRVDAKPFRVFLCRRLHLALPLTLRTCRCGRQLDKLSHHRGACAVAGLLGRTGFELEFPPTSTSGTWTWQSSTTRMDGVWRLSHTVSLRCAARHRHDLGLSSPS